MDRGRIVAMGTNNELKAMIRTGEIISVEAVGLTRRLSGYKICRA